MAYQRRRGPTTALCRAAFLTVHPGVFGFLASSRNAAARRRGGQCAGGSSRALSAGLCSACATVARADVDESATREKIGAAFARAHARAAGLLLLGRKYTSISRSRASAVFCPRSPLRPAARASSGWYAPPQGGARRRARRPLTEPPRRHTSRPSPRSGRADDERIRAEARSAMRVVEQRRLAAAVHGRFCAAVDREQMRTTAIVDDE